MTLAIPALAKIRVHVQGAWVAGKVLVFEEQGEGGHQAIRGRFPTIRSGYGPINQTQGRVLAFRVRLARVRLARDRLARVRVGLIPALEGRGEFLIQSQIRSPNLETVAVPAGFGKGQGPPQCRGRAFQPGPENLIRGA